MLIYSSNSHQQGHTVLQKRGILTFLFSLILSAFVTLCIGFMWLIIKELNTDKPLYAALLASTVFISRLSRNW